MSKSREHKHYHIDIMMGHLLVATTKNKGAIQASSPCKAVELFHEERGHTLRKGHVAVAYVHCESGLILTFDMVGS